MNLRLQVTSAAAAALGAKAEKVFGTSGGVVGRSADTDWQLPDAERRISGRHFKITFVDRHFMLTDLSANGTFLNDADTAIGKGKSVRLQDGDVITVEAYTIGVDISAAGATAPFGDLIRDAVTGLPNFTDTAAFRPELATRETLDPLEMFGASVSPRRQPPPGAEFDHSPIEHDSIHVPAAVKSAIPDDWDPFDDSLAVSDGPADADFRQSQITPPTPNAHVRPSKAAPREPTSTRSGAGADSDLFAAFLRGAGIGPEALADLPPEEIMETVGRLFVASALNLRELLLARVLFKSGFGLEVTAIQSRENNPLKFSVGDDVEYLVRDLFEQRGGSYLTPVDAFEEAFSDIKDHQLGIIAGMRAAFQALLARFDPREFSEEPSERRGPLNWKKNADNWEAYCTLYDEMRRAAEDDAKFLFGEAFTTAYANQVRER